MDTPTSAAWPPTFPAKQRLQLTTEARAEFSKLEWQRETDDNLKAVEWYAHTPHAETLSIVRGAQGAEFQSIYIINGNWEDPVLQEIDLGHHRSFVRARAALADYVVDHWASYRAWEERTMDEMAQDQAKEDMT